MDSNFSRLFYLLHDNPSVGNYEFNYLTSKVAEDLRKNQEDRVKINTIINNIFEGFNFQGESEKNWFFQHLNNPQFEGFSELFAQIIKYRPKMAEYIQNQNTIECLDGFNLLKTETPSNYATNEFMWFLAQAILQSKKNVLPEVQNLLDILTLLAFGKASSINDEAAESGMQTSPFYGQSYHRDRENPMLDELTKNFADECGLSENEVHLVSTHLISEAIRRQISSCTKIKSYEEFEAYLDNWEENFDRSDLPKLIDISDLTAHDTFDKEELQEIRARLSEIAEKRKSIDTSPLFKKIIFIDYTKHKDQPLLINFTLNNLNNYYLNHQFGNKIENIMKGGFRISPDQAKVALTKMNSLENILAKLGLPMVSLNTPGSKFPEDVFNDLNAFTKSKVFREFRDLSELPYAPPYLKVIPKTIASLIEGFKNQDIDQIFKDKGINDLLQASYFILKNAMGEIILRKDDFLSFNNNIELIQQIIQSIIVIANPYNEKAFEAAVVKKLSQGRKPVVPKDLNSPKVHLKHSAMGGFASILAALSHEKKSGNINVISMEDCYFELPETLDESKSYRTSTVAGSAYRKYGDSVFDLDKFKKDSVPVDLFICEFHHNLNPDSDYVYEKESVKEYIKLIFNNKIAAEKMTVLIDNTIDLEASDELRDLLADPMIKELIQSGRLNLVCLRSAQKYDMLGMDNYYGGVVTTFNDGSSFSDFNKRMNHKDDQLKGISYQGLTHLQIHGKRGIDEYKKSVISNTQLLYKIIPQDMIESDKNKRLITFSKKNDSFTPFLALNIKHDDLVQPFNDALDAYIKSENLLYTTRDSYGFMNMNKSEIEKSDGAILRFCPGLESPEHIEKYAKFFYMIREILDSSESITEIKAKLKTIQ